MSFKFFKLHSWDKRSADHRRRLIQRLRREKEKNGFKKAFLRAWRKPEEAGGQYPQGVCRIRKAPSSLTAAQSRPPLRVLGKIGGTGGQGGGLYFAYPCGGGDHGWRFFSAKFFQTGLKSGKNMLY